jgi:hypothetical protein
MIMEYSEIPYNTDRECFQIEDVIIRVALEDGEYKEVLRECEKHGINLQYDDVYRTKANLVKRTTGRTWTKIKREIQDKSRDYHGILPTREGYLFQDKVYESLEEAHYIKLKKQYPKLARIMYES